MANSKVTIRINPTRATQKAKLRIHIIITFLSTITRSVLAQSMTELCDLNRQKPLEPGRYQYPDEYAKGGLGKWVTLKKEDTNGTQIPKCWALYRRPFTFKKKTAIAFCRDRGYRLPVFKSEKEQQVMAFNYLGNQTAPTTVLLGMNLNSMGLWEWTDDLGLVSDGYSNWQSDPIPIPTHNDRFCAFANIDVNPQQSYWFSQICMGRGAIPIPHFGLWCQKDMFRIIPCGNCMSRSNAVTLASTFTCSLENVRLSNRKLTNKNTNRESNVIADVQSTIGSVDRVSRMTLGYRWNPRANWVRLATYKAQGYNKLVITGQGNYFSHRTIKGIDALTSDGKVKGNTNMKLTLTYDPLECLPEFTGQVLCLIEYFDGAQHKYPKVLGLMDFTYPAHIHEIYHSGSLSFRPSAQNGKGVSMFDTLNQTFSVRFEMGHANITFKFEILFCNGSRTDVPSAWFQSNITTRAGLCTGTGFENEMHSLTLPSMTYTPDMCCLYFALVYNFQSGGSDSDGSEISEERYVIEEAVYDVRPNCSSTLKKALPYEHLGLAATYGGMVTGITVAVLWFSKELFSFCRCLCRKVRGKKSEASENTVQQEGGGTARTDVDDSKSSTNSSKRSSTPLSDVGRRDESNADGSQNSKVSGSLKSGVSSKKTNSTRSTQKSTEGKSA